MIMLIARTSAGDIPLSLCPDVYAAEEAALALGTLDIQEIAQTLLGEHVDATSIQGISILILHTSDAAAKLTPVREFNNSFYRTEKLKACKPRRKVVKKPKRRAVAKAKRWDRAR